MSKEDLVEKLEKLIIEGKIIKMGYRNHSDIPLTNPDGTTHRYWEIDKEIQLLRLQLKNEG